ncbi:GNAT family N-acetyltransferase [Qipengyuania sediminis]|uniref:GNAT family N-acetyltransferase n=1 Tax=Qipengyuania sediminis TaxID=1532023 RepID=UPI001059AF1B|nr:GNAT family N-acetyltransferase [Qipengyuania sediminis]
MIEDRTLDAVMEVMEAGFDPHWREAWSRAQVADSLALPSTFLLLLDKDARPVLGGEAAAFVLSRQALDEEELLLIVVHPDQRGRGLGARTMARYMDEALRRGTRRIYLEMRANNPAHALYRRCGFTPIGARPRYYRTASGEAIDAITFARRL